MIGIITDSTCDIPEQLVEKHGIIVVPQAVIWGEEQFRDRIDLQPAEFYTRLAVDPTRPHSSLPSLRDFQEAYDKATRQGADELIVLTVSHAMSGTFEMAQNAAKLVHITGYRGGFKGSDDEPGLAGTGGGQGARFWSRFEERSQTGSNRYGKDWSNWWVWILWNSCKEAAGSVGQRNGWELCSK